MPSPRLLFQTVMNKSTQRAERESAIDALAELDATTQLRVVAVSAGLDGPYRRRAVNALGRCRATETLDGLADDTSLDSTLRKRAAELA
jgi:hypothetical protein